MNEEYLDGSSQPGNISSRIPGFYELSMRDRLGLAKVFAQLTEEELSSVSNFGSIAPELVEVFIENAIGTFALPLGVATNFLVNGRDILVPMAVEETSVVAAASHGAKLIRAGGGFVASSDPSVMTGQIQLFPEKKADFDQLLGDRKQLLIDSANIGQDRLLARGGGAKDLDWRYIESINMLILHLYVDTQDAMGANIVNTMCERVSTLVPEIFSCAVGLRILTNLTMRRRAKSCCRIPATAFASDGLTGRQVIQRIEMAYQFAAHDIFRAATNNKGVMNGIDPVVIATGNDWRAVEAGAHAFAAVTGCYKPLTKWTVEGDELVGSIELPMAVGTVGGVTKLHPTAQASLKLLGNPTARELAEIIASVGLAQNLSALRALATEGIQRGHMSLHQKNLELMQGKIDRQGATQS